MAAFTNWTSEEDTIMRSLWPTHKHAQLAEHLPGRTASAVKGRAFVLGLMKTAQVWTPSQDAYLQAYYPTTENTVLAAHLNLSINAVKTRANRIGCKKDPAFRSVAIRQRSKDRVTHPRSTIKNGKVVKVKQVATGPKPWLEPMGSTAYQNWMQSKVAGTVRTPFTDSAGRVAYRYARQA